MKMWPKGLLVTFSVIGYMSACAPGAATPPLPPQPESVVIPERTPESADTGTSWLLTPPILGRVKDSAATLSIIPRRTTNLRITYTTREEIVTTAGSTKTLTGAPARVPVDVILDGLEPNTRYYYQIMCRRPKEIDFEIAHGGEFHTMRERGTPFIFTIQADSHMNEALDMEGARKVRLYRKTLKNVLADGPDFHIDMGDFAGIEWYSGGSAQSLDEALERYLLQRTLLGEISHSVPFYLVIGNHEGEQGWRRGREADSLEVFGTLARKALFPNPYPDEFYMGGAEETECCGLREGYYAWEWSGALFVVLDPFWNTMTMPHRTGRYEPSDDAWDWTLGIEQYNWLYETLSASDAKWKFVFSHHVTGGYRFRNDRIHPYGRGGIVVAKHKVAGEPSFEWGGEDENGNFVFEEKRPGWSHGPVHDLMVSAGVDIFFHGHDHVFVYETLDGIVYQTCPEAANPQYNDGFYRPELFLGDVRNNSGHLRIRVSPDSVLVEYVRAVLGEDEPLQEEGAAITNGDVSYSYSLTK